MTEACHNAPIQAAHLGDQMGMMLSLVIAYRPKNPQNAPVINVFTAAYVGLVPPAPRGR